MAEIGTIDNAYIVQKKEDGTYEYSGEYKIGNNVSWEESASGDIPLIEVTDTKNNKFHKSAVTVNGTKINGNAASASKLSEEITVTVGKNGEEKTSGKFDGSSDLTLNLGMIPDYEKAEDIGSSKETGNPARSANRVNITEYPLNYNPDKAKNGVYTESFSIPVFGFSSYFNDKRISQPLYHNFRGIHLNRTTSNKGPEGKITPKLENECLTLGRGVGTTQDKEEFFGGYVSLYNNEGYAFHIRPYPFNDEKYNPTDEDLPRAGGSAYLPPYNCGLEAKQTFRMGTVSPSAGKVFPLINFTNLGESPMYLNISKFLIEIYKQEQAHWSNSKILIMNLAKEDKNYKTEQIGVPGGTTFIRYCSNGSIYDGDKVSVNCFLAQVDCEDIDNDSRKTNMLALQVFNYDTSHPIFVKASAIYATQYL